MELESPSSELTSPEEETAPAVEVFELQEDSGSDATPDMDPQVCSTQSSDSLEQDCSISIDKLILNSNLM